MALTRWVLLLRGVNVGGHGRLPMAELRAALVESGARNPRTLIQSGNAVFDHEETAAGPLAERVCAAVAARAGFAPAAMALEVGTLAAILDALPPGWPREETHVWVTAAPPPAPRLERLAALAAPGEAWRLEGRWLALHAPAGVGRSKFAPGAEAALGVPATARKASVLARLLDLAREG
ncbi:DUF1697 domain-containing protein [Albimonas pacifica]|uniref:Uncharacterized conserved protein, DUF1697 family n=1 Tax=Albimonas pacifica TaxID=1114924 RepID=A0A1I3L3E5_9RHOB|nr:DUF1697 domain-containing protein [Albimonas pacifica]SFI79253.1 Uncharacterized conserved protein, DUF1697 family [Albimonas pacifica]